MLEWSLEEGWGSARGQQGRRSAPGDGARPGRHLLKDITSYLLPCHKLFHGYPSPEEEARAVGGEIAFCKIFHLELLNILNKAPGKHMVFPRIG